MNKECINVIVSNKQNEIISIRSFIGRENDALLNKEVVECFINLCSEYNVQIEENEVQDILDDGYVENINCIIRIFHSQNVTEIF